VVTRVHRDASGMVWPTCSSSARWVMREMIDALALEPGMNVLEIGTGTGYNAALPAEAGARVVTVEIDPELSAAASAALERTGFADRVSVATGDGEQSVPGHAPFDRVIVTAAARTIPYPWVEQARDGGRIALPYSGPECVGALVVLTVSGGTAEGHAVGDAYFMPPSCRCEARSSRSRCCRPNTRPTRFAGSTSPCPRPARPSRSGEPHKARTERFS